LRVTAAQPVLSEAVQHGRLRVVGAVYELATGKVQMRPSS